MGDRCIDVDGPALLVAQRHDAAALGECLRRYGSQYHQEKQVSLHR